MKKHALLAAIFLTSGLSAACVCGGCSGCSSILPQIKSNVWNVKQSFTQKYNDLGAYYYNKAGKYIENIQENRAVITTMKYQNQTLDDKLLNTKIELVYLRHQKNSLQKILNQLQVLENSCVQEKR